MFDYTRRIAPRMVAMALIASFCLPGTSSALRVEQVAHSPAGLEEIRDALTRPETTGLEEIELHLGAKLEGPDFAPTGDPQIFSSRYHISQSDWSKVNLAKGAVLRHYPVRKDRQRFAFTVAGQSYQTSLRYDSNRDLRLLIQLNAEGIPLVAYAEDTQEIAYQKPSAEIELHLGATLEGPEFAPVGKPFTFKRGSSIRSSYWSQVKASGGAVLRHYPSNKKRKRFRFIVSGQEYFTTLPYDSTRDLSLLIEVNSEGVPLVAYAEDTQEIAYQKPSTEIELHLGATLEGPEFTPVERPLTFKHGAFIRSSHWSQVKASGGAVLRHYPARKSYNKYAFQMSGQVYTTDISYDSDRDLRLLVQVDASGDPVIAYAEDTGEVAYTRNRQGIELYLGDALDGFDFVPTVPNQVFQSANVIRWSHWSQIKASGGAVFRHYPVRRHLNKYVFHIAGQAYPTGVIYESGRNLYLLVQVNAEGEPLIAYAEDTGEMIYEKPDVITIPIELYLGATLDGPHFESLSEPQVFKTRRHIRSHVWPEVAASGGAVLRRYPAIKRHEHFGFRVAGQRYKTTLPYESDRSLSLLLQIDAEGAPVVAYAEDTGEVVYGARTDVLQDLFSLAASDGAWLSLESVPSVVVSAEPVSFIGWWSSFNLGVSARRLFSGHDLKIASRARLESEKDVLLLSDQNTAIGLEEIELYLGAKLEGPDFAPSGTLQTFSAVNRLRSEVWDAVRNSGGAVLRYLPATRRKGKYGFRVDGQNYTTSVDYVEDQPLQLLIHLDRNAKPVRAYVEGTSTLAFEAESQEIELFVGAVLSGPTFETAATPQTFRSNSAIQKQHWEKIEAAKGAVLRHYPTSNKRGKYGFRVRGRNYHTDIDYVDGKALSLLIQVDAGGDPVIAYAEDTGDVVYEKPDVAPVAIAMYLGAELTGPEFASETTPQEFTVLNAIRKAQWQDVGERGGAVFQHYPTHNRDGVYIFVVSGEEYATDVPFERDRALRLLLQVNDQLQPVIAYDEDSGVVVYQQSDEAEPQVPIDIHVGATLSGRDILGAQAHMVLNSARHLRDKHWTPIDTAGGAVFEHYPARSNGRVFSISISGATYPTDVRYDASREMRLLMQVDAQRQPLIAIDEQTGDVVYRRPDKTVLPIHLYVGATLDTLPFVPGDAPIIFPRTGNRQKGMAAIKAAGGGVLVRYPSKKMPNKFGFKIAGTSYTTTLDYDASRPTTFLLQVDANAVPLIAYDTTTQVEVYRRPEVVAIPIEVYLGERLSEEVFEPTIEAVVLPSSKALRSGLWGRVHEAGSAVLRNYPTRQGNGKYTFVVNTERFQTNVDYVAGQPMHLLLEVNAEAEPVVALNMATGEQVYPVIPLSAQPLVDLVKSDGDWLGNPDSLGIGLEEIELYLGAKLQGSDFVSGDRPQYFSSMHSFRKDTWQAVRDAGGGVLRHLPAIKEHNRFAFRVAGERYQTTEDYNPSERLMILVQVDENAEPVIAYSEQTGDVVYRRPVKEQPKIQLHLGAHLEDAEIVGSQSQTLLKAVSSLTTGDYQQKIAASQGAVLENYPAKVLRSAGVYGFRLFGQDYRTVISLEATRPGHLLIQLDAAGEPLVAYDQLSGEMIYEKPEDGAASVELYLAATLDGPEFVGQAPLTVPAIRALRDRHWDAIREAGGAVFKNYSTKGWGSVYAFKIAGGVYHLTTIRRHRKGGGSPPALLLEVDGELNPIAAYDQRTGNKVFPRDKTQLRLHVGATLEGVEIKSSEPGEDLQEKRSLRRRHWEAVRLAGGAVLEGFSAEKPKKYKHYVVRVRRKEYQLSLTGDGSPKYLLLELDADGAPIAAYDQETQEKVYPAQENPIQLYLGYQLDGPEFAPDEDPDDEFLVSNVIRDDTWGRIKDSGGAVFIDFRPGHRNDYYTVAIKGEVYRTSLPSGDKEARKFLVEVDEDAVPTIIFDMTTQQQVYPVEGAPIEFYIGEQLLGANFESDSRPEYFTKPSSIKAAHWDAVKRAGGGVLLHLPTTKSYRVRRFRINQQQYRIDGRYASDEEVMLSVGVNANAEPVIAYNEATGEQVFDVGVQALSDLAVLAASDANWLGNLGTRAANLSISPVAGAHSAPKSSAPSVAQELPPRSFSTRPDLRRFVRVSKELPPDNFSVLHAHYSSFSMGVSRRWERGIRVAELSVEAQAGLEEIELYLGETLDGNKFDPKSTPVRFTRAQSIKQRHWDDVQDAGGAVVRNYSTWRNGTKYVFKIGGVQYQTTEYYDPKRQLRLRIEVDADKVPIIAYTEDTDVVAYERPKDEEVPILMYLGRKLRGPNFKSSAKPISFPVGRAIRAQHKADIKKAGGAVFLHVPMRERKGKYGFGIVGGRYRTNVLYDPARQFNISVQVDGDGVPVIAYAEDNGEVVYRSAVDAKTPIKAYMGATLSGSEFESDAEPLSFKSAIAMRTKYWDQIREAGGAVLVDYPGMGGSSFYRMRIAGVEYNLNVRVEDIPDMRMLIQVDENAEPVIAYERTTGEVVYRPADEEPTLIELYPGETLSDLSLETTAEPLAFTISKAIRKEHWQSVRKRGGAVLRNYPASNKSGQFGFTIKGNEHRLDLDYDAQRPLLLMLQVDEQGQPVTIVAQDTEEKLQILVREAPANPILFYPGEQLKTSTFSSSKPAHEFPSTLQIRQSGWQMVRNAGGGVFVGYPAPSSKAGYRVSLAGERYHLGKVHEDGREMTLLIEVDSDARLVSAYDQETGDQVYPRGVLEHQELVGITVLAQSNSGWLNAAGLEELFEGWSTSTESNDAFVLSNTMLDDSNAVAIMATLARMPENLASRTYLVGDQWRGLEEQNPAFNVVTDPGLESTAVAILQQVPEPSTVWVVGENLVGLGGLLNAFGMQIKAFTAPSTIAEFLLQMGRALGVPEGILQSSLETFFSQQSLDLAA